MMNTCQQVIYLFNVGTRRIARCIVHVAWKEKTSEISLLYWIQGNQTLIFSELCIYEYHLDSYWMKMIFNLPNVLQIYKTGP